MISDLLPLLAFTAVLVILRNLLEDVIADRVEANTRDIGFEEPAAARHR